MSNNCLNYNITNLSLLRKKMCNQINDHKHPKTSKKYVHKNVACKIIMLRYNN